MNSSVKSASSSHLVISLQSIDYLRPQLISILSKIDILIDVQRDLQLDTVPTSTVDTHHPVINLAPDGIGPIRDIARDHMAQSSIPKTPLGVPVFWESGANPTSEWSTWFGTLKMAIMARDNIVVDKLLKLKPTRAELFYPTLPTYEDPFEGETEDEERQREQRNEKRKVDWENECKQVEYRGPMINRTPWDEADLKVKSLIYLSLGTEGCRTYHQRNPHTRIEHCTTNELVHELSLTFTRPRNLTFDRFQFFRALQQSNETLETFYSRLPELGSHAKLEHLVEDLVKDLFISNMHSSNIQKLEHQNRCSTTPLIGREDKRTNKKFAEHTPVGTQSHTCVPTNNKMQQHRRNHKKQLHAENVETHLA